MGLYGDHVAAGRQGHSGDVPLGVSLGEAQRTFGEELPGDPGCEPACAEQAELHFALLVELEGSAESRVRVGLFGLAVLEGQPERLEFSRGERDRRESKCKEKECAGYHRRS